MKFCQNKRENYVLYFHNLKFDGEYIFNYLLNNGYECIKDKKERRDKTFTTLISDTGQFYSIEIFFDTKNKKHINKVTIYDSLKILNFSVEQIAKDFNLPIRKLELDYKTNREIGHVLTQDEIDYIRNDVEIMARALKIMFDEKLTKMTIGSDALSNYKDMNKNFNKYFPVLPYEIDKDIRKSYKGGFTYLNDVYKEIKPIAKSVINALPGGGYINQGLDFVSEAVDKVTPITNAWIDTSDRAKISQYTDKTKRLIGDVGNRLVNSYFDVQVDKEEEEKKILAKPTGQGLLFGNPID